MTLTPTDFKRWKAFPGWSKRAEKAVKYLPDGVSVLDVGSGRQELKKWVKGTYQPLDCVAMTPDTIVCDLNAPPFPDIGRWDYAVCLGVVEYLVDPRPVLAYLGEHVNHLLVSYHPREKFVQDVGWLNSLTKAEFESMLPGQIECLNPDGDELFYHTKT